MDNTRQCNLCLQTKPLNMFYKRLEDRTKSCSECLRAKAKKRYEINAEALRAKAREYRANNPEKIRKTRLAWKRANPEKNTASSVAYQRRNPEKHGLACKTYREKNKDKYKLWALSRRDKLASCKKFAISDREIKKLYSSPCVACGAIRNQTIDHIIPIDLGGSHGIGNLQTLCLSCNSSKRNRVMTVWKKSLGGRV